VGCGATIAAGAIGPAAGAADAVGCGIPAAAGITGSIAAGLAGGIDRIDISWRRSESSSGFSTRRLTLISVGVLLCVVFLPRRFGLAAAARGLFALELASRLASSFCVR